MSNKIVIFDVEEVDIEPTRSRRERSGTTRSRLEAVEVDAELLSERLSGFIESVRGMLARVSETVSAYEVDKVEVQAQISAEGKVGFMGSGVGTKGSASLKIVLARRKADPGSQ